MIKIYEPYKLNESIPSVSKILSEGNVSYQGIEHTFLTKELENFFQSQCILMSNGTCAMHMCFEAAKSLRKTIESVLVPDNVYVAAWNSAIMSGLKLIPISSDEYTWNISLKELELQLSISDPEKVAVLIVHNVGNIVNVPLLKRKYPKFLFIEDNCEGFTGKYEGIYSGTSSDFSGISFYANKTITSGEGGAFLTQHQESKDFIKRLYSQGQTEERYVHDILAYNYRMTNLQATLLLNQFNKLQEIIQKKNKIWDFYDSHISNKFLRPKTENRCEQAKWMYTIRLPEFNYHNSFLQKNSFFETRPMFYPMSTHKHLKQFSIVENENIARLLSKECFMLPSHPNLEESQLEKIVKFLNGM